ncbi:MAG: hypothetical protein ACOCRA_03185, partial [Halobacteria archaeon]
MSKKIVNMKDILNSSDWAKSPMGLPPERTHFREVGGTKHAVCSPSDGTCEIHEDEFNPDEGIVDMVCHAFYDLPEDLQKAIGAVL